MRTEKLTDNRLNLLILIRKTYGDNYTANPLLHLQSRIIRNRINKFRAYTSDIIEAIRKSETSPKAGF
ncbi:hypothetical protein [Arcticibacter tournemirensis]|uniref:Uncharacterized protein n=1 Tax=Arcticibacter tournemirensis TaxID=699437 RepID=A0A4Q0MCS5_9SPHI|nr:hypothetical protein [Arcticibacter tournemirensis]RXF71160.1 hypothetical protein EKH83_05545 [Arcticibacter tournemirensis]